MYKWFLLALSLAAVVGVVDSIKWLRIMQQSSAQEIERFVGYSGYGMSLEERENRSNVYKYSSVGLQRLVYVMLALALAVVGETIRAFLQ
jgi:hypothetical protein